MLTVPWLLVAVAITGCAHSAVKRDYVEPEDRYAVELRGSGPHTTDVRGEVCGTAIDIDAERWGGRYSLGGSWSTARPEPGDTRPSAAVFESRDGGVARIYVQDEPHEGTSTRHLTGLIGDARDRFLESRPRIDPCQPQ